LQYADDTLIFIPNDYNSLTHAKRILRWFELTSSLRINFYKSSLVGINLDEDFTAGMARSIFCRWDSLPINYLGLPLEPILKDDLLGNQLSLEFVLGWYVEGKIA
jgi:hypothetical protein